MEEEVGLLGWNGNSYRERCIVVPPFIGKDHMDMFQLDGVTRRSKKWIKINAKMIKRNQAWRKRHPEKNNRA